jgi:hypothetical protein
VRINLLHVDVERLGQRLIHTLGRNLVNQHALDRRTILDFEPHRIGNRLAFTVRVGRDED